MSQAICETYVKCILLAAVIMLPGSVSALPPPSSDNYTLQSNVISGGGGEARSGSYILEHTTGQQSAIGKSTGNSFINHAGFWYTVVSMDNYVLSKGYNLINYSGFSGITSFMFITLLGNSSQIEKIEMLDSATGTYRLTHFNASGDPDGDNFTIAGGNGLTVYAHVDRTLSISYRKGCGDLDLAAGVNVVGLSCAPGGMTAYELLTKIGNDTVVVSVQGFNAATGQFETVAYYNSSPVGPDFQIGRNAGYIIHMIQSRSGFSP